MAIREATSVSSDIWGTRVGQPQQENRRPTSAPRIPLLQQATRTDEVRREICPTPPSRRIRATTPGREPRPGTGEYKTLHGPERPRVSGSEAVQRRADPSRQVPATLDDMTLRAGKLPSCPGERFICPGAGIGISDIIAEPRGRTNRLFSEKSTRRWEIPKPGEVLSKFPS